MEKHEVFEKIITPLISDKDDVQALVVAVNNIFVHGDILIESHSEQSINMFLKRFYDGVDIMNESVKILV